MGKVCEKNPRQVASAGREQQLAHLSAECVVSVSRRARISALDELRLLAGILQHI